MIRTTVIDEEAEPLLCLVLSIEVGERNDKEGVTMSSEWTRPEFLRYQV